MNLKKNLLCIGNSKLFSGFQTPVSRIEKNARLVIVGLSNHGFLYKLKRSIRKKDSGQLNVTYEQITTNSPHKISCWNKSELADIALSTEWLGKAKNIQIEPCEILGQVDFLVKKYKPVAFMIFGDKLGRPFRFYARKYGIPCINMESGYFRPGTFQIDMKGVNAESSIPHDIEFYKNYTGKKYNVSEIARKKENMIFLPFQMESDTQIFRNSPRFKTMADFLDTLGSAIDRMNRESGQNTKLLFKEHPLQHEDSYYKRETIEQIKSRHDCIVEAGKDQDTGTLIERAKVVCVINSTVGFEAIMKMTSVAVFGNAFYGIDGLVTKTDKNSSIKQVLENAMNFQSDKKLVENFLGYVRYHHHRKSPANHPNDSGPDSVFSFIQQHI